MLAALAGWLTMQAAGAQAPMKGAVTPYAAAPFVPDADVACLSSALETGEPAKGASTWILKAPAGCVVRWHWHTAQEQPMVVSGEVMAEMSDHPPTLLGPGGFALMGGHMAHQFTCRGNEACLMFVAFASAYDITWGKPQSATPASSLGDTADVASRSPRRGGKDQNRRSNRPRLKWRHGASALAVLERLWRDTTLAPAKEEVRRGLPWRPRAFGGVPSR